MKKAILLLLCLLMVYNASYSQQRKNEYNFQTVNEMSLFFLNEYLSYNIQKRAEFIEWFYLNDSLKIEAFHDGNKIQVVRGLSWVNEVNWFLCDFNALTEIDFSDYTIFDDHYTSVLNEKKALFKLKLSEFKEKKISELSCNKNLFPNHIFVDHIYFSTNPEIFPYLDFYFMNTLNNRILYIEKYYKDIELTVLELMKKDIDTLLEISTPALYNNNSILDNCKLWKAKMTE